MTIKLMTIHTPVLCVIQGADAYFEGIRYMTQMEKNKQLQALTPGYLWVVVGSSRSSIPVVVLTDTGATGEHIPATTINPEYIYRSIYLARLSQLYPPPG